MSRNTYVFENMRHNEWFLEPGCVSVMLLRLRHLDLDSRQCSYQLLEKELIVWSLWRAVRTLYHLSHWIVRAEVILAYKDTAHDKILTNIIKGIAGYHTQFTRKITRNYVANNLSLKG